MPDKLSTAFKKYVYKKKICIHFHVPLTLTASCSLRELRTVALPSLLPCDYSYLSTLYFQNSNGFFKVILEILKIR